MVASDSTFARVLGWLRFNELQHFLHSFRKLFENQDLLQKRLSPQARSHRLGILDGTYMGGHWLETLCLAAKINCPAIIRAYNKQGQELSVSRQIIRESKQLLGPSAPTLWLLDALYFDKTTFQWVRKQDAHILVKVKDAEYRTVTRDAENLFQHFGGDREDQGFDNQRLCSWKIQQTTDSFTGYPVQVIHLVEDYPKRLKEPHAECSIVTTDLTLSLEQIREAAHQRWQIENNTFKRLSHLSATKRFYFKDQKRFINMLHLFFAALACYNAIICILSRHERIFKSLLQGIKPTWRNIFSQIKEVLLQIKCPFQAMA
jgi:hypothetical protein